MPPTGESMDAIPRGIIITFIIVFLAIIASGFFFYQSQEQQIKDQVITDLTSISTLKANQIAAWREDRLYDARIISAGAFFSNGADHFMTYGDDESRENILSRFHEMNASLHYDNAMLVDPQGNVRLSLDPTITSINPSIKAQVNASLKHGDAVLTDFYRVPGTQDIRMNVIAPLYAKKGDPTNPVGAVVLTINPDDFLYPLIQSWPVPSRSAETLLVEREGDHVLFLNELRHQPNTALNLTIPVSQTDVPAVKVILGTTGAFVGEDYRGVDVISVLGPVSGSPWFMVAKVDAAEAYTSWRSRSVLIIVLVAGTLVGTFIIIGLIWQRRQKSYYRSLYTTEAERRGEEQRNRERLETLLRLSEMGSASEQELMDYVLNAGCRLTNSSLAFMGMMSPDETVFDITSWSKSAMKDCTVAASPIHFPIEKAGIWAEAVRKRKPLIVNDYPALQTGKKGLPPGHVPITRFVSVPIFDGQRIVMVCAVANKETDYSDLDVDNLILMTQSVWNHLRKRSADDALRKKTTDLEAAYEEITASDEELAANYAELEKSQKALTESERKYRNLYQYAQVGLFETSLKDARVVACNQRYCDLFGFPSIEDAIGKDVLELYASPDERTKVSQILRERGLIENHTVQFRNQINKKIFWGQFSARYNFERDVAEGSIIDITAQMVAEAHLKETNEYLTSLFDYANAPIIVWDRDFKITRFNHAFERLTGCMSDMVIGKPVEILFPKDTREHSLEYLRQAMQGERWETVEIPILRKDGIKRIVLWNSATLFEDDRTTVIATIAQGQDITDRKWAEEALQKSEHRSAMLLKAIPDMMFIISRDGVYRDFSVPDPSVLALPVEKIIGTNIRDSGFKKESEDTIIHHIGEALRTKKLQLFEYDLIAPQRKRQYEARMVSLSDEEVVGIVRDITDRKQAEDALRQSEEKYRVLFTRMVEGSALHDMVYDTSGNPVDYRIVDVNPAFEATLRIKREEVIGKTSREAYGVDVPPYLDIYARVAGTGQPEWFEVYFEPMKKYFAISAYSTKKGRFATIFEDITERRQAEELREHFIKELEQKNAELERFTYTVSHDLKSPLITIKGFAGLIEDDAVKGDPVQLKKDISRITAAADTMQELLADVLELSRIGRIISPPEKTSFGIIAHEAVELLAGPLAERGVTVTIAPDLPLVNVDHARIREVMVNLIENAVKFLGTQQEPVIHIGVEMDGTTPVFFVKDNGIGIDPRYLERIFNLFERLDVSTHGTGIGLTIVRRIIEVHGGKIWAESEGQGKGTTFRFTLPGAGIQ